MVAPACTVTLTVPIGPFSPGGVAVTLTSPGITPPKRMSPVWPVVVVGALELVSNPCVWSPTRKRERKSGPQGRRADAPHAVVISSKSA